MRSDIQLLNPIDRAMRCADTALRRVRYPGLETQTLVWLEGPADSDALRTAIARLCRHFPVLASRLVEPQGKSDARPYWRFRPDAVCPLREASVPSDNPEAVLDLAGQLLSSPYDPAQADPIRFHLLHRPGGKDVLLLQYNHVLMDNKATVSLLRELDRLSEVDAALPPQIARRSLILDHLRRFPHEKRRKAALDAIHLQAHVLRGRAATLRPIGLEPVGMASLRIITRTLEPSATNTLRSRVIALCGFPCFSMAVLGSAFRAIDRLRPASDNRRHFVAGIGMGLDLRSQESLIFQNLTSAVPIYAAQEQLHDRDQLLRLLNDQMRERLAVGTDLGALRTTAIFSRRPRYIEWVVEHLLRYGYSLWYAYFGALDAAGHSLCGTTIDTVFYTGPVWSSIGLTLLVNQYRGRLHFQVTYDPRVVSPSLANAFLDSVLQDLTQGPR